VATSPYHARLMQELTALDQRKVVAALRAVPIATTHRKPPGSKETAITRQLRAGDKAGLKLLFSVQFQ
jgi:hypothetical protein